MYKKGRLYSEIKCNGKKLRFEIKKILKYAAFLLEMKLRGEFRKSKTVGQQRITYLHGVVPGNLTQFRSFLGLMKNIVNISFGSNPEIESKILKNNEEISKKTNKSTTRQCSPKSFGLKQIGMSSVHFLNTFVYNKNETYQKK